MIKSYIKTKMPEAWMVAKTTQKLFRLIPRIYGYEPRCCNICGRRGRFFAEIHFPDIFVFDAICPSCSSNSRNRLLKKAIDEMQLLGPATKLLHFAPETPVTRFVAPNVGDYKTADLFASGVDYKLNIEQIDQPDQSWDLIICSHVLEHVDHRRALCELRRILKPSGKLLALFPVVDGWDADYENSAVRSERDRGLHFGKENHLRRFGRTVRDEFVAAGLELHTYSPIGAEIVDLGLIPGETLFIGTRR